MHRIVIVLAACSGELAPLPSHHIAPSVTIRPERFPVDTKWALRCTDGPIECSVYESDATGLRADCGTPDGHRALSFGFDTAENDYGNDDERGCVDQTIRRQRGDALCFEHTFITRAQWEQHKPTPGLGSYSEFHCPSGTFEELCMSGDRGLVEYHTHADHYDWRCDVD
jgi:hypothetical protein